MLKAKLALKRLFLHQFRLGLVWILHKPSVAVLDAVCDDIRAAKSYCADDVARIEFCDVHAHTSVSKLPRRYAAGCRR